MVAFGVLGVLLMSGEYSTGMIRSSLTAVPRRLPVLWAKLAVFAGSIFSVSLVASFISFFLGQALLNSHDLGVPITAPDALRSVIGAALYLTVAGLIGVALGALLRNTAAGITIFAGVFFVLPPLATLLPASISDHLAQYLPSNAGGAIWGGAARVPNALSPWTGFALLCGYAVIVIGAGGMAAATMGRLTGGTMASMRMLRPAGYLANRAAGRWVLDVLVALLAWATAVAWASAAPDSSYPNATHHPPGAGRIAVLALMVAPLRGPPDLAHPGIRRGRGRLHRRRACGTGAWSTGWPCSSPCTRWPRCARGGPRWCAPACSRSPWSSLRSCSPAAHGGLKRSPVPGTVAAALGLGLYSATRRA